MTGMRNAEWAMGNGTHDMALHEKATLTYPLCDLLIGPRSCNKLRNERLLSAVERSHLGEPEGWSSGRKVSSCARGRADCFGAVSRVDVTRASIRGGRGRTGSLRPAG